MTEASLTPPCPGRCILPLAMAAASLLVAPAPARADDEQEALELYKKAVELAKEGKYEEALPLFEEAQELGAPPVALYNIARCYESMGKYELAIEFYERYKDSPGAEDTGEVEATIKELLAKPSIVTITTDPPRAEVSEVLSDTTTSHLGKTPIEFSAGAGSHTYLIEKEGYKGKKIKLKTGAGKPFDLEMKLEKSEDVVEKKPKKKKEPFTPGRTPLGLAIEAGGGVALHAFKGTDFKAGGIASLGLGWRFAHGTDTGFSIGLRASLRPYRLSVADQSVEHRAIITTILAVPAFQLRLGGRLGLEASVPLGLAILSPVDTFPDTDEIELVGGTITGGGVPLFDVGLGAALRIMLVSSLYLTVEPVRLHLLIPMGRGWRGTKLPVEIDIAVRLGFEI